MNSLQQNTPEMSASPVAVGEIFWRRKWLILLGIVIGFALAVVITLNTHKRWRADAQMVLIQRALNATTAGVVSPSAPIIETVDTQAGMIQSPAMAERTITYLKNKALTEGKSSDSVMISPNELSGAITVYNPRDTDLLNVSVSDKDPVQAAVLTDAVCHAFEQWKEDMARRDARIQEESFAARAARAKVALEKAEKAMTSYKVHSGLVDESTQERAAIERLQSSQMTVMTAQQDVSSSNANLNTLRSQFQDVTSAIGAGQFVRDDNAVQSLQARLAQAQADLSSAQTMYQPSYPGAVTASGQTYTQLHSEITSLKTLLATTIKNTLNNKAPSLSAQGALRDAYLQAQVMSSIAQAKLAGAIKARAQVQGELDKFPKSSLAFSQLERNRLLAETQYMGLQAALNAAQLDEDKIVSNIQITQGAEVPSLPYKPNVPVYLILGVVLGGLCASFLALLLEQSDQRLRNMADVRRLVSGPVVAILPQISRSQFQSIKAGRSLPEVQEAVSFAWVTLWRILQRMPYTGEHQTLLITSATPREGKTFVANQLARFVAQTGKRVILVDANLNGNNRRKSAETAHPGLTEVLRGSLLLSEALHATDLENLHILHSGASVENPVMLLSQPGIAETFRDLRTQADIVIVDAPDCTSVPDTALLASFADCLVQVIGMNRVDAATMLDTSVALQSTNKPTVFFVNAAQSAQSAAYRNQSLMFGHFGAGLPAPSFASQTQELSQSEINPLVKPHSSAGSLLTPNGQRKSDPDVLLGSGRGNDPAHTE